MGINGPPSYTYCANGEHNMLWIWPRILPLIIKGKGKGKDYDNIYYIYYIYYIHFWEKWTNTGPSRPISTD